MKKKLTKLLVGDYIIKIFGKMINFPRAANIIFPSLLIAGTCSILLNNNILSSVIDIIAILISLFAFFGPKILKFNVDDYDASQKFQMSKMVVQIPTEEKVFKKGIELSKSKEVKDYIELISSKRNYNILPFLLNPILIITALTLLFIFLL